MDVDALAWRTGSTCRRLACPYASGDVHAGRNATGVPVPLAVKEAEDTCSTRTALLQKASRASKGVRRRYIVPLPVALGANGLQLLA